MKDTRALLIILATVAAFVLIVVASIATAPEVSDDTCTFGGQDHRTVVCTR